MFEILDLEDKIYLFRFGNGKTKGFVYFSFDDKQIKVLSGLNTAGKEIDETTIINDIKGKINPTKVILFIVKVLKKVLCPSCV